MKLYLCEKPSQAKDTARVLGATKRGQGYFEGADMRVTVSHEGWRWITAAAMLHKR